MKCLVSKNSVFKSAILTLVGVLCFAVVGFSGEGTWGGITVETEDPISVEYNNANGYFSLYAYNDWWADKSVTVRVSGSLITSVSCIKQPVASYSSGDNGNQKFILSVNGGVAKGSLSTHVSSSNKLNIYLKFMDGTLYYSSEPIVLGPQISGTPAISTSSNFYCDDARPTLSYTGGVTVTNAADGFPKYDWYNSSNTLIATTSDPEWTATRTGTYYCVVKGDASTASAHSNMVVLSSPTGLIFSTTENSLEFEHNLCPSADAPIKTFTFTRKSGCDNVDAADVNSLVSIVGTDAAKFSKSVRKTATGTYEVTVTCVSTEAGTFDDASLVISEGGEMVSVDLSATVTKPSIALSSSSLTLTNENGATPKVETITVTRNNSCAEVQVTNSNSTDFEVVKVDDNTFTITYKNNTYDSEASPATGTITFSSDGATSQTLMVEGSVSACSETAVATFDFDSQDFGTLSNGVELSTTKTYYKGSSISGASSGPYWWSNMKEFVGGSSNRVLFKDSGDLLKITGLSSENVYRISMLVGSCNTLYGDASFSYTLGSTTDTIKRKNGAVARSKTISTILNNSTSVNLSVTGSMTYVDDIVVIKLCPPDVRFTVANECTEGAMTFTAQASVMSASTIASYQWYKDGVAISGATSATFTPAITYAKGSLITVKVTDDLGMTAESKPYEYDCGATIESVTLDATSDFYCAGMTITATVVASCDEGYPQYEWYKDGIKINGVTTNTYQPYDAGTYTVRVYADATKYKEASETYVKKTPTIVAQDEVAFEAEKDSEAKQKTITVSLDNSCSTLEAEITGGNASMYSVTDNHDGTYTITFTPNSTKDTYPATLVFKSADGLVTKSVTLNGKVLNCVGESIASFDFDSKGLGSTEGGVTLSVSSSLSSKDQWNTGYHVGSDKVFTAENGARQGVSGKSIQFYLDQNDGNNLLSFTGGSQIIDETMYSISFLIGENGDHGTAGNLYAEVSLNGSKVGDIYHQRSAVVNKVISGADLKSGVGIDITRTNNINGHESVYYIDNISIAKVCPPEIKLVSVDACDVNSEVVAMAEQGTAAIKQYDWYIIDGADDDEPVETHPSSSDMDTYTQTAEIGHGKTIKVVVTDENGITAEASVVVNCGPEIEDITAPAKICPNTDLTMSVPNITAQTGDIKAQGWEISQNENAASEDWTTVTSLKDLSGDYDDWYIRYFAVDDKGRGKSNAVQITMFDAPTIGDFSIENICQGETFTLTGKEPTVVYSDGEKNPSARWEYATESDFSDKDELTESIVLSQDTYYVRYVASDCANYYSEVKEVEVYTPHIEVKYANDTYYRTASSLLPITEEPTLEHPCVDGPYTYAIASGNGNGYFTIDPTTGVISLTEAAKSASVGEYPITVTATNGSITSTPVPLTITISNDPELTLDCSSSETYYVYSKYQKLEIDKELSSAYVNADVTLELTGDVSNFELSSSSVLGNSVQHVSISNVGDFSSAGTYTITLTATTEGEGSLSKECEMSVIVENLDLSSEKKDQMVCGGIAETLSVIVTGEDQTHLPLSYQWYKGTTAVAGATSKDFTPTVDGVYSCKVSLDGEVIYTSESSDVKFAPNSPIVTFKGTVPDEVYCSQEIPLELSIVDKNNNDLSSLYKMFTWEMDSTLMRVTSNGKNTFTFDCSQDAGKSVELSVTFSDPDNGCEYVVSKTVSVKAFDKVYYYCGSTGSSSNLTDVNNWCTVENANTSSCTHPVNFTTAGCEYIINKNGVELLSGQTWNVGGDGTKITAGNGIWENNVTSVNGWSQSGIKSNNSDKGLKLSIGNGEYWKENTSEKLGNVARTDYRSVAQTVKISGTMNLADGVSIDVTAGTNLEIATNLGNPTIGNCTVDELVVNDNSNMWVRPGSMVTYSGAGAEKIQDVTYSNIFINTSGDVTFPKGVVEVKQTLKYDQTPASVTTTGNTVLYSGAVDQLIEPMTYNNLDAENATNKTLGGNVTVNGVLTVGSGATLNGGATNNVLTMTGSGDVMNYNGKFKAGNSTVRYTNSASTEVEALHYYNLDISGGERVLPNGGTVGIAGTFTPSEDAIVTGSTVEFDGKLSQTCPAFTFDKLLINNTAPSEPTITLTGDVNVTGHLIFQNGIVKPSNENTLTVTNGNSNAVGGGNKSSYIEGKLTWNLPPNADGSDQATTYLFPVGTPGLGYNPLILTTLTTGTNPVVTVGVESGEPLPYDGSVTAISNLTWTIDGNADYTTGAVSLYNTNNTYNFIAYTENKDNSIKSVHGTQYGSDLLRSDVSGSGYYTVAKQSLSSNTYYYDCSKNGDITDIHNWYTAPNGSGEQATDFSEGYTSWVIQCDATINSASRFEITGPNAVVKIEKSANLTVGSSAIFSEILIKSNSTLTTVAGKDLTVLNSMTMESKSTFNNAGISNIYVPSLAINSGAKVINQKGAEFNTFGTDLSIYAEGEGNKVYYGEYQEQYFGHFLNYGAVKMVNGALYMKGISAQLMNANGAVWKIDNSGDPSKEITFECVDFRSGASGAYVDLQCGSAFYAKNSDVILHYYTDDGKTSQIGIAGDFVVEDGNLEIKRYAQGGGHFTIQQSCGTMIVNDTDNSGDGLLELIGTGGSGLHVAGTLYTMGIVTATEQAGNHLEIQPGGFAFIGNLGAVMSDKSWEYDIQVQDKGTLYYCGNRTAGQDNVGKNQGYMCYASSYYDNGADDPISQGDFTSPTPGTYRACFESMESCQAAFDAGVDTKTGILLPIELTMLHAVCNENNEVEIRWQTASETNNEYFTILRSFDGVHFEELDIVWGAGTTTEFHNYEYIDKDDNDGIVYYKLRQTDYNGEYTESKVIAVQTCGPNAQFRIAEDQIDIFFKHPEENSFVVITSVTGQIFYSKSFKNIEAARIAAPQRKGVYIISVIDSKTITSEKFIR